MLRWAQLSRNSCAYSRCDPNSLNFGIDTNDESSYTLCHNGLRDRGLRYVSLFENVFVL